MKPLFFSIIALLLLHGATGAQTGTATLNGVIVSARDTIPYEILLTETNGNVSGYSLTYNQPYETKAKITGVLDRHNHTFSFKETEIIYIHGYHSGPSLCLVDAALNEVQSVQGRTLKGPITSKEADHTSCTSGSIIFNNDAEIQNLFSYHEKYDTIISMKNRKKDENTIKTLPAEHITTLLVTDKITVGEDKTYDWYTDTAIIDIWDGGNVDGDLVTVQFNGKVYLSSYSLVKEKKQLRIPLSGKSTDIITIHADNEGSDPPNTASILLTDGMIHYSLLAYNKKGQDAIVKLKRQNKVK